MSVVGSDVVTADELAKMAPEQRAALVATRRVSDLDKLSEEFRAEIEREARRLGGQRRASA
jgi:hypothetical protein